MYTWVASWFSEENPTNDETVYTEQQPSTSSAGDQEIKRTGSEWTWVESIMDDDASNSKTQYFIQSSYTFEDPESEDLKKNQKAYKQIPRNINLRSSRRKILPLRERRLARRLNSPRNERQLVRYCRDTVSKATKVSKLADLADSIVTKSLLQSKPVVKYVMEMDMRPSDDRMGYDLNALLDRLLDEFKQFYERKITKEKPKKKEMLLIEWKKPCETEDTQQPESSFGELNECSSQYVYIPQYLRRIELFDEEEDDQPLLYIFPQPRDYYVDEEEDDQPLLYIFPQPRDYYVDEEEDDEPLLYIFPQPQDYYVPIAPPPPPSNYVPNRYRIPLPPPPPTIFNRDEAIPPWTIDSNVYEYTPKSLKIDHDDMIPPWTIYCGNNCGSIPSWMSNINNSDSNSSVHSVATQSQGSQMIDVGTSVDIEDISEIKIPRSDAWWIPVAGSSRALLTPLETSYYVPDWMQRIDSSIFYKRVSSINILPDDEPFWDFSGSQEDEYAKPWDCEQFQHGKLSWDFLLPLSNENESKCQISEQRNAFDTAISTNQDSGFAFRDEDGETLTNCEEGSWEKMVESNNERAWNEAFLNQFEQSWESYNETPSSTEELVSPGNVVSFYDQYEMQPYLELPEYQSPRVSEHNSFWDVKDGSLQFGDFTEPIYIPSWHEDHCNEKRQFDEKYLSRSLRNENLADTDDFYDDETTVYYCDNAKQSIKNNSDALPVGLDLNCDEFLAFCNNWDVFTPLPPPAPSVNAESTQDCIQNKIDWMPLLFRSSSCFPDEILVSDSNESLGEIWKESDDGNSWDIFIPIPEWLRMIDVFPDNLGDDLNATEQPTVASSTYMGLGEIWRESNDQKSWDEYIPFPQWLVDMDMFSDTNLSEEDSTGWQSPGSNNCQRNTIKLSISSSPDFQRVFSDIVITPTSLFHTKKNSVAKRNELSEQNNNTVLFGRKDTKSFEETVRLLGLFALEHIRKQRKKNRKLCKYSRSRGIGQVNKMRLSRLERAVLRRQFTSTKCKRFSPARKCIRISKKSRKHAFDNSRK